MLAGKLPEAPPLAVEYLPAKGPPRLELVLLHGWGVNREVWRPLLTLLRPLANVTLLEFAGNSRAGALRRPLDTDALLAAVLDCAPQRAVYLGWSLGGMLAAQLAASHPQRVAGLVTLCSNAVFVAQPDWPGMAPDTFEQFRQSVAHDPAAALQRFCRLQASGSSRVRPLTRRLEALGGAPDGPALAAGLAVLKQLDLRDALAALEPPQLHLFAANDALVPPQAADRVGGLLARKANARCRVLADVSHALPLEAPGAVYREMESFCRQQGLLAGSPADEAAIAKADVARSFSQAAASYDSVAELQREVGHQLLQRLPGAPATPARVMDLGCGTGYFSAALARRYPGSRLLGLDLAAGMVHWAREHAAVPGEWLVGDAENLPLASASVDVIFSSLVIQWCQRLDLLWAELARVLRPGGACVFATLGPGTLAELRRAWATVDDRIHVNSFKPAAALAAALPAAGSLELSLETAGFTMRYDRVRDLLAELKGLGAHNMNRGRQAGLTSRRQLQGMLAAYEEERRDGQLPASYEVIFGIARKT